MMLPDPLHPALVHFPIVLLLLGAPLAVLAVFIRGWNLPALAAVTLAFGAAGAVAATWTGGKAAELTGELNPAAEDSLNAHEEWGERARNAGLVAGVLAVASAALIRKPLAGRSLGVLAALASIVAALFVAQAGHQGGQLVYKNGVGIDAVENVSTPQMNPGGSPKKDNDD
jgi:uncharacterized membrane protein